MGCENEVDQGEVGSMNIAINGDCMEVMRQYPDKYFDLAVVDPPERERRERRSAFLRR